jgi:endonuclease III
MPDRNKAERVAWVQPSYGERIISTPACALWVVSRLEDLHHSADLGNRSDPIEELVWIPLTRQTHRQNSIRSWQRIVDLGGPAALLEIPVDELAALLKDAGFSRQKASWIKTSLDMVVERFGSLSLEKTESWTDDEVEALLTTLPGIAIKSAKCVMMYSMGRQVLPMDTHLRRLAERLGWVPAGLTERRIHSELEDLVEPGLRYSLHVNAIWHGRSVCRALRPRCDACVLREGCQRGINEA